MEIEKFSAKKLCWISMKESGSFKDYENYEVWLKRDEIMSPPPTDPKELKEHEKERLEKEDKDWREKHLLTDEHRRIFDSWGSDADVPNEEPELSEDEKKSLAKFNELKSIL